MYDKTLFYYVALLNVKYINLKKIYSKLINILHCPICALNEYSTKIIFRNSRIKCLTERTKSQLLLNVKILRDCIL